MSNPYQVVEDFEQAICDYTGAPYCVTTTSCTMAILLALNSQWGVESCGLEGLEEKELIIPQYTYVGVPMSAMNAGFGVEFHDNDWDGEYILWPASIYDSARRFTSGMYRPGAMQCLSFHWSKTLSIGQGGAILLDSKEAATWLRAARFDGRTAGEPIGQTPLVYPNYHAYMTPEQAALGLMKLSLLPEHNEDLPWGPGTNSDYPDLSKMETFK